MENSPYQSKVKNNSLYYHNSGSSGPGQKMSSINQQQSSNPRFQEVQQHMAFKQPQDSAMQKVQTKNRYAQSELLKKAQNNQ